mgnify:CR=1
MPTELTELLYMKQFQSIILSRFFSTTVEAQRGVLMIDFYVSP